MKAVKKNKQAEGAKATKATTEKKTPVTPTRIKTSSPLNNPPLIIGGIMLLTLILYLPCLHYDFLKTWDDQIYVTHNPLLKNLSFDGIKRMFKEDRGMYANYHPLTILSLALNYHDGGSSFPFHLTNVILHLLNTLLVFVFIYLLTGKKLFVAAFTSLLFGIHPMHVESVAWISERKDVLYTFFYLLSLIAYWKYVTQTKIKEGFSLSPILLFSLSLLFFFFSSLSKAMAASLPVVLFMVDYFMQRKLNLKLILEKLPFVIIAAIIGLYAMKVQAAGGATQGIITFPVFNKIFHAFYGFTMYIVKVFVPAGLSAFYPYPYPLMNSTWMVATIPGELYATFFTGLIIVALTIYLYRKGTPLARAFVFGVGFYLASIALVLQYFPVGRTIMSDRYSYIPYIGLFFIIGYAIDSFLSSANSSRRQTGKFLVGVAVVYVAVLCVRTVNQIKVWKNDEALWTATINNYPGENKVVLAYNNRAVYYFEEKKFDAALNDFLMVAKYDLRDANALEKIGRIYGQNKNDLDDAIIYFEKAMQVDAKNIDVLRGLGTAYGLKGQYTKSLDYTLKAIALAPDNPDLYTTAATSYFLLGDKQKADEFKAKAAELEKKEKGK